MIHISIVDSAIEAISTGDALNYVEHAGYGAAAVFVGIVRNHNEGRQVTGVSYDVHDKLAQQVFSTICQEARQNWGEDLHIYVAHAKGHLQIGGIATVIAVGSPHRDESFKACRYIIEQIKQRAPVWKQEHYLQQDSQWLAGSSLAENNLESCK